MTAGGAGRSGTVTYVPPGRVLRDAAFAPAVRGFPGGIADMVSDPEEDAADLEFGDGDLWEPGTEAAAGDSVPEGGLAPAESPVEPGEPAVAPAPGRLWAGRAARARTVATEAGATGAGPTGAAAARPFAAPVSVWQQSAAAWQEAGLDWLRPATAAVSPAGSAAAEDPHTEPIPVLTEGGSPSASRAAKPTDRNRTEHTGTERPQAGQSAGPPVASTGSMLEQGSQTGAGSEAGAGNLPGGGSAAVPGNAAGAPHEADGASLAAPGDAVGAGSKAGSDGLAVPGKAVGARDMADQGNQAGGRRRGRRLTIVAVTAVVLAAGTLGGLGIARSGGGGPAAPRFRLITPYPPAVAADASLAGPAMGTTPLPASLTGVAAAGQTVVAIGAAPSQPASLPLFLVSTDGGHTWSRAATAGSATAGAAAAGLSAAGPSVGSPGAAVTAGTTPVLVARGGGTWLALAQHAAWTSSDGRAWQQAPALPPAAGDTVLGLAGTAAGFVAVGAHTGSQPGPVVWTSAAGQPWQRASGATLGLTNGGHLAALRWAAAEGGVVLAGGRVPGATRHDGRLATGLWRSTDNGHTWNPVGLPGGHGATGGLAGLAATGTGFVAVRSGHASGRQDAVTYLSAQGSNWRYDGKLTPARRASFQVTAVSGSSHGFAVAGSIHSSQVAFFSAHGHGWQQLADPGTGLAGLTAGPGGAVLVAGNSRPGSQAGGSQPHLLLLGRGGGRQQAAQAALAAAASPDVTVNGLAAAGRTLVAAGASGGSPALWLGSGAGRWAPTAVLLPTAWRAGALLSVAHGARGWLAIGQGDPAWPAEALAAAPASPQPVMLTSATGRSWTPASGTGAATALGTSLVQAAAGPSGYVVVGSVPAGGSTARGPAAMAPAAWFSADLGGWARVLLPAPDARTVGPGTGTATAPATGAAGTGTATAPGTGPAGTSAATAPATGAAASSTAVPRTGAGTASSQVLAVTAARSGFVAVGSAGGSPAVWTSQAGSAWAATTLPRPAGAARAMLDEVTAAGGRVVAVGYESRHGSAPGTGKPFAAVSANGGRTWRESVLPTPPAPTVVTTLTAAGGGFVAVGNTGPPGRRAMLAWWSPDGSAWRYAMPAGRGLGGSFVMQINAVTAGNGTLTGAGFAASSTAEHPVLWHARYR